MNDGENEGVEPDEDVVGFDEDDGCVGDEDSGALGFGGYGERGDDDPRDHDIGNDEDGPWGVDGMGPDGE